jgi:hypothetical protein
MITTMALRRSPLAIIALLLLPSLARAEIETFGSQIIVQAGTVFGNCQQLTAHLAGAGGITILGGSATLASPTAADAAAVASTTALPNAPYVVRTNFSNYDFSYSDGMGAVEVFALLVGLTIVAPQTAPIGYYQAKAVIEVATYSDLDGSSIYVQYWDANKLAHSWNGSTWVQGFKAAAPLEPGATYVSSITSTAGGVFNISVTGTPSPVNATIPVNAVLGGGQDVFLVVGDLLTSGSRGSATLDEVESPCPTIAPPTPDAGVPTPDQGPLQADGPDEKFGDQAVAPVTADISPWSVDIGGPPLRPQEGCDCTLGQGPGATTSLLVFLFCLLQTTRKRTRRRGDGRL